MKRNENQALQRSLRCLQHPAVWISIAVLLINDHVLKATHPSWLTGKLSDFAGLFFFPYLIAVVLAFLLGRRGLQIRLTGALAFGSVALWFALLKTIPLINWLTAGFVSWCLGFPVYYSLDPTDLISLSIVIPAWIIWMQPGSGNRPQVAYVTLALASVAVIATSPPPPRPWPIREVTNLEFQGDGIILAADVRNGETPNSYSVAISLDGGLTWEQASEIQNIEEKNAPIKHCSHLHPYICYRLDGSGKLKQLNQDEKWVEIPTFVIETDNGLQSPIAYDFILFEWEEKEYVLVAVGRYGVMRRELPDGEWEKIPVLNASD